MYLITLNLLILKSNHFIYHDSMMVLIIGPIPPIPESCVVLLLVSPEQTHVAVGNLLVNWDLGSSWDDWTSCSM